MPIDILPDIAARYQVPQAVVRELYRQLQSNNGTSCQFGCPELAGQIQWMPGMVNVSRPTDHNLKARVDGLCCELAALVRGSDTASPAALARDPATGAASACVGLAAGESWWPAKFGHPDVSGEQNGARYAYFPRQNRLLVQQGARIEAYDTADTRIRGAAQQQGHTTSLTFATDQGPISTKQMTCVPLV